MLKAREVVGVEWNIAPDRVEPGEEFTLTVRVYGDGEDETTGEAINFYINGDPLFTTTGADIPAGDFSFDGSIDVVIDDPGTYELTAEVAGYETAPHYIGVGEDPDPDAVESDFGTVEIGGSSISIVSVLGGAVATEVLRRIFT